MKRLTPVRTVPPNDPLVSLPEIKAHCRVEDTTDHDAELEGFVLGVLEYLEGYEGVLGCCFVEQTWTNAYDMFPPNVDGRIDLTPGPVKSISTIEYRDPDDHTNLIEMPSEDYYLARDELGDHVRLAWGASWPSTHKHAEAVIITYIAGEHEEPAKCSQTARIIVKQLVGHWFENREAVSSVQEAMATVPLAADMLIKSTTKRRL